MLARRQTHDDNSFSTAVNKMPRRVVDSDVNMSKSWRHPHRDKAEHRHDSDIARAILDKHLAGCQWSGQRLLETSMIGLHKVLPGIPPQIVLPTAMTGSREFACLTLPVISEALHEVGRSDERAEQPIDAFSWPRRGAQSQTDSRIMRIPG